MADASLDDMLLEAAGRTTKSPSSSRLPSRSLKRGRHSNSEEEDDSSGFAKEEKEEDEEEERRVRGGSSNSINNNGYQRDISFGSDLYKDEDDRAKLAGMSELDREMILHDSAEMRDNFMMRKRADARHKKEGGSGGDTRLPHPPPPSAVALASPVTSMPWMRSSVRDSSRSVKENALHELVARRQKAHNSVMQRRRREVLSSTPEGSGRTKRSSHDGSAEPDFDATAESRRNRDDIDTIDTNPTKKIVFAGAVATYHELEEEEDNDVTRGDKVTFQDVLSITITRAKLDKWYMEPYFEDIIPCCFVRVGIGMRDNKNSVYRLCLVRNVDARDPHRKYKFGGRITHKYLNLVWGNEASAARWQMDRISNKSPTVKEFKDWEREVELHGSRRITTADITQKKEAIAKLSKFVYCAELVKQMLHEKKMMSSKPANIVAEKFRIMKELALNETNGDHAEAERARARLKELELYSAQSHSKDAKALALARMNQKNRYENFINASMIKPVNSFAKAGEVGYDPFSRRWTRSQDYYAHAHVVAQTDEVVVDATALVVATPTIAEAKPLPYNAYALQEFNLPISLAGLQKFGGAQGAHLAHIARKQRLEATCGVQIAANDNHRHTLTLTVNDYKGRRALL